MNVLGEGGSYRKIAAARDPGRGRCVTGAGGCGEEVTEEQVVPGACQVTGWMWW